MFSTPKKGVLLKEGNIDLQIELNCAWCRLVQRTWTRKEQERNVTEDMELVRFAPFLLVLLLSISGEKQDSE